MNELNKICVFCGSSPGNSIDISDASKQLGQSFAERNITLVYGAAKIGVMGLLAQATTRFEGISYRNYSGISKKERSSSLRTHRTNNYP